MRKRAAGGSRSEPDGEAASSVGESELGIINGAKRRIESRVGGRRKRQVESNVHEVVVESHGAWGSQQGRERARRALPGLRWARTGGEALDGEVVLPMRRAGEGARTG
jgi:hypothetical protein